MKRFYAAVLTVLAALAATSAPARAALRVPQIPFTVSALQTRFNNLGESINVATQQQDGLVWGATVSGNSVFTIQFDLGPVNPGNNGDAELGIAKAALQTANLSSRYVVALVSRGAAPIDASGADAHGSGSARHVPFVMSGPNIRTGVVVAQPTTPLDVAPTIHYALGAAAPSA